MSVLSVFCYQIISSCLFHILSMDPCLSLEMSVCKELTSFSHHKTIIPLMSSYTIKSVSYPCRSKSEMSQREKPTLSAVMNPILLHFVPMLKPNAKY